MWIGDLSFSQTSQWIETTCELSSRIASTSTFSSNFTSIVRSSTVGCTIRRSGEDEAPYNKTKAGKSSLISSRVLVDAMLGVLILLVVTLSFRYWQISGEIAYNSHWVSMTGLSRLLSITCWITSGSSMFECHRVRVVDE